MADLKYPNDFGIDSTGTNVVPGACGRLQNLLLWNGENTISSNYGGLTFRQIFGDPGGGNPYPFGRVIGWCMWRLALATELKDNELTPTSFLHTSRYARIAEAAGYLMARLGPVMTLEELMVTPNANWPQDVQKHSQELEGEGISLPHMHRDGKPGSTDIPKLIKLFDPQGDNFYAFLGHLTPAKLYTSAWNAVPHATVKAAREAHALENNPGMLDSVDPRYP